MAHAAGRDSIGLHVREHQARPLDDAHKAALGLLHLVRGAPKDEHGFGGPVDEFLGPPQHTEYAGMGDHTERGLVAYVGGVACGGRVVHADCALGPLDLGAQLGSQQVARAGDNHTLVAPGGQRLAGGGRKASQHGHDRSALLRPGLPEAGVILPILKTGKPKAVHSTFNNYLQQAG